MIRDRQLEIALETLSHMHKQGIKIHPSLYDMMIYTLCSTEEFDEALRLMEQRLSDGELLISASLWLNILDTASRALHHAATSFAYRARVQTGYLNPPSGICTNVLSTAARHGDVFLATSVLRVLSRRSGSPIQRHHYEALLETYIAASDLQKAFALLSTMQTAGHPPTEASTRPIYTHLRQSPKLPSLAARILTSLKEEDRPVPIAAINVVIESHIAHHDLASALHLYKKTSTNPAPDTATFNALLRGCSQAARKDTAMFLASEMLALSIPPNALTYDRLILVCLTSEVSLEDAWRYFMEMRAGGWWPRGGTMDNLARRACGRRDSRVRRLVGEGRGKGIAEERLERIISECWRGGGEVRGREIGRWRGSVEREKIEGVDGDL